MVQKCRQFIFLAGMVSLVWGEYFPLLENRAWEYRDISVLPDGTGGTVTDTMYSIQWVRSYEAEKGTMVLGGQNSIPHSSWSGLPYRLDTAYYERDDDRVLSLLQFGELLADTTTYFEFADYSLNPSDTTIFMDFSANYYDEDLMDSLTYQWYGTFTVLPKENISTLGGDFDSCFVQEIYSEITVTGTGPEYPAQYIETSQVWFAEDVGIVRVDKDFQIVTPADTAVEHHYQELMYYGEMRVSPVLVPPSASESISLGFFPRARGGMVQINAKTSEPFLLGLYSPQGKLEAEFTLTASNGYRSFWDGTGKNSGQPLPPGIYILRLLNRPGPAMSFFLRN